MKKILLCLLAFAIVGGSLYLIQRKVPLENKPAIPSPSLSSAPQAILVPSPSAPAPATPACEPMQYALTRIFAAKAYADLMPCLAPVVRFSRFESSQALSLGPEELVTQVQNLSAGVNSWITNPDDPAIKKLREAHINAWSDAYIVLADNARAFAFTLDKDGRIWTAVYIDNYLNLIP